MTLTLLGVASFLSQPSFCSPYCQFSSSCKVSTISNSIYNIQNINKWLLLAFFFPPKFFETNPILYFPKFKLET